MWPFKRKPYEIPAKRLMEIGIDVETAWKSFLITGGFSAFEAEFWGEEETQAAFDLLAKRAESDGPANVTIHHGNRAVSSPNRGVLFVKKRDFRYHA